MKNRKEGYYWVRHDKTWVIAYYDKSIRCFYIQGEDWVSDTDDSIEKIIEEKIIRKK